MIKILFYIDTLHAGGAEKVLCTLVNNMDQTRFDITVMTPWPEDAGKYLSEGIIYRSLYSKKSTFNRYLYRLESALGLTYRNRIHGDFDIEVAYLECAPTKVIAGSTNKKALKLAWVHCDLAKKAADINSFVRKSKKWYAKFDSVVCVANSVHDSFIDLYGNQTPAIVLHNINDEDEIISKTTVFEVSRDNRTTITAVGRLSYEKGNDRLLNVGARLKSEGYDFCLWLIGDGQEKEKLEQMIIQLSLEDHVKLFGFQSNPYPYINSADLIVCPSRFEGFSTVVTEALILEKPVVTTSCSGMDELLGDNEYGLITENSEEGLYEGLKKMLNDPSLLKHYEAQAKIRGASFSKERLVKKTEDFFTETLGVKTKQ